jgi:hypothetical protein
MDNLLRLINRDDEQPAGMPQLRGNRARQAHDRRFRRTLRHAAGGRTRAAAEPRVAVLTLTAEDIRPLKADILHARKLASW